MRVKRQRRPHHTDDSEARVIASAHDASSLGLCDMGSPEDRRYIVERIRLYACARIMLGASTDVGQWLRIQDIFKEITC